MEAASPPALSLRDITCIFNSTGATGEGYVACRNASVVLRAGEFVAVVGPTGCGKSTLLNVAAGLLQCTSGEVLVYGAPLSGINRRAGYMFQADSLLPWLTAARNVSLGLELRGAPSDQAAQAAENWLARVGLAGYSDRYPHQLSGGMKKRVSLAQMLVLDPEILLMDEPFSALDIQTRQLMENELLEIWRADRKSVLFVTHDLEEAISLADRVVVLSAGPGTSAMAEFDVSIARPRDVTEIVQSPEFRDIHHRIWETLKGEVLKSYRSKKL